MNSRSVTQKKEAKLRRRRRKEMSHESEAPFCSHRSFLKHAPQSFRFLWRQRHYRHRRKSQNVQLHVQRSHRDVFQAAATTYFSNIGCVFDPNCQGRMQNLRREALTLIYSFLATTGTARGGGETSAFAAVVGGIRRSHQSAIIPRDNHRQISWAGVHLERKKVALKTRNLRCYFTL